MIDSAVPGGNGLQKKQYSTFLSDFIDLAPQSPEIITPWDSKYEEKFKEHHNVSRQPSGHDET